MISIVGVMRTNPDQFLRLLFIGDVIADPGMRAISAVLPKIRQRYSIDCVVANSENIADGNGVTAVTAQSLFDLDIDVLTNGNHVWDKPEVIDYIKTEPRLIRPCNFPDHLPGQGYYLFTDSHDHQIAVINVLGNRYMFPDLSSPFEAVDRLLQKIPDTVRMILVDMHAESAFEKAAMAWHLDGRVSAVLGTHTHIPTADEKILPGGTAFQTDVGMTGCYNSVVGMDIKASLDNIISHTDITLPVADGKSTFSATLIELNKQSGCCDNIKRIYIEETESGLLSLVG